MARLLYYPSVLPPTEVIHQALLYWDGFGSVVPREPELRRRLVRDELADLEACGLFAPVHFGDETDLGTLNWPVFRNELRRLAASGAASSPPDSFIWLGKTTYWLEDQLEHLGLATRRYEPGTGFWQLIVPAPVYASVMAMAARQLAATWTTRDCAYFPYTDNPHAHGLATEPISRRPLHEDPGRTDVPAWQVEIGQLLPVPAAGTALADVLAFRERYADERERLMRVVHRLLGELRRDYEYRADIVAGLRREIGNAVDDYRGARRAGRIVWVRRSIMATVAVAATVSGALIAPEAGWVLGPISGVMIDLALRETPIRGRFVPGDDFAYLHRIGSELT